MKSNGGGSLSEESHRNLVSLLYSIAHDVLSDSAATIVSQERLRLVALTPTPVRRALKRERGEITLMYTSYNFVIMYAIYTHEPLEFDWTHFLKNLPGVAPGNPNADPFPCSVNVYVRVVGSDTTFSWILIRGLAN